MYSGSMYYTGSSKPGFGERVVEVTKDSYTWLRDYVTAIKYGRLHPFTSVERKAREATRKDPWGPTGLQLAELAELSHAVEHCQVIYAVLEFRLSRGPHKWRNVYKALLALEYLLVRGSQTAVELGHSREIGILLQQLTMFDAIGAGGTDYGANVRIRSTAVLELLHNAELLQQRRAAAMERIRALSPTVEQQQQQQQQMQQYGFRNAGSSSSTGASGGGVFTGRRDPVPPASATAVGQSMYAANIDDGYNAFDSRFSQPSISQQSSQREQQQQRAAAIVVTPSSYTGGFGEAKGVSFEENKLRIAELRQLLARPENKSCADCRDATPAGRPSWASINLGVFICMRCAGTHRGLGAHVSKVRSCTLDTWLPEQVVFMANTGNAAANDHFEAGLSQQPGFKRPARESPEMAAFIRRKYIDQSWVAPGSVWPPPEQQQQQQPQQQQGTASVQQRQTQNTAQPRQPQRTQLVIKQPAAAAGTHPAAAAAVSGFEDSAFPAVSTAAAAVADLLCLDDASDTTAGNSTRLLSTAAAQHSSSSSGNIMESSSSKVFDIMDAPMDIPDAQMSVIDWIEQRIATGADAAAQAAADAARQQRQRHHHSTAAARQQQQQQQYVFDPFVNGTAQQQQQQQQQQQVDDSKQPQQVPPAAAATAAAMHLHQGSSSSSSIAAAAAGHRGLLHSISRRAQHLVGGGVISTYEFSLSSDDDSDSGESADDQQQQQQQQVTQRLQEQQQTQAQIQQHLVSQSSSNVNGSSTTAHLQSSRHVNSAANSSSSSSNAASKPEPKPSSSSTVPLLLPVTPGYSTSTPTQPLLFNPFAVYPAAAAAGRTGAAAAAAGRTGTAAAAGYTAGSTPGPYHHMQVTGRSSRRPTGGPSAGFIGGSAAAAAAARVYYAPAVAAGFGGGWGGWGGYATVATAVAPGARQQQQQQQPRATGTGQSVGSSNAQPNQS